MKLHFLLFFITVSLIGHSKSFRSLSSINPIKINLISKTEGYKDIHLLAINKANDPVEVPLKLQYIINRDTLVDYIVLKENIRANIKTLFLFEGDSIQVVISIASTDTFDLKIIGNVSLKEPMLASLDRAADTRVLPGNYWDVEQPLMFRIVKTDSVVERINFEIDFNENFHFDNFYFQVNIISPDSNFRSVMLELIVNSEPYLTYNAKSFTTVEDFKLESPGKYIIELVPFMSKRRINGINSVGYKLVR